jgi:hypothetical protein
MEISLCRRSVCEAPCHIVLNILWSIRKLHHHKIMDQSNCIFQLKSGFTDRTQWEWSDIHPSCGFGVTHIHSWIILGVPYLICMGYSSYLPILKRIYSCNSNTLASHIVLNILWLIRKLHHHKIMDQSNCIFQLKSGFTDRTLCSNLILPKGCRSTFLNKWTACLNCIWHMKKLCNFLYNGSKYR